MSVLLKTEKLCKVFGGLAAVMDLDLTLDEGLIVGLIGPNGAGKSTVMNMIGGAYRPTRGRITCFGRDITRWPSHQRAGLGIARVFQENILFNQFSVLENVMVGFHLKKRLGPADLFRFRAGRTGYDPAMLDQGRAMLEHMGLGGVSEVPAGSLPHGGQRILSLAIARAAEPRLLLLDEPLTGLNAEEVAGMTALIKRLRDESGITCLVVEHNVKEVMGLCDRIVVLDFGSKIAEGLPGEIAGHPRVIEAYLGDEDISQWTGQ